MSDRLPNLHDTTSVCDFIESVLPYIPEKDRKPYETAVEEARAGGNITPERLVEFAHNIAAVSWPSRRALQRFLETVGSELEWEGVIKNVRPSTASLLKKLRKDAGTSDLTSTLKHPDASYLVKDDAEIEIGMVRDEVRADLYEEQQEHLGGFIEESVSELEAMKKRLKRLKQQAIDASGAQQDSYFSKYNDLEARIYYAGEAIPLEILDAEVQFDAGETVLEG